MKKKMLLGVIATFVVAGTSHAGTFLLDYGSPGPYNTGRTVSGSNTAGGFTVFQSFTVTDAAGWNISTVGTDGWSISDPNGSGIIGSILGVDGGGGPDEGNVLGTGQYFLQSANGQSSWVDVAFNVILPQGDYFMRFDSFGDPDSWSAIFGGDAGNPGSFSRRESDGAIFDSGSIALRIDGVIAPAPGAFALLAVAGIASRRRRRA